MDNLSPQAPPPVAVQLADLIRSLEQASQLAKQLPTATDPNHLLQIYSSLHQSHSFLSSFLSQTQLQPQPPLFFLPPHPTTENSLSSSAIAAGEEEPMQEEYEGNSNMASGIDKVEEKMRDFFIKNKRVKKRPLSPSSVAAGQERTVGDAGYVVGVVKGFDPHGTRLSSLDLIYQFHA